MEININGDISKAFDLNSEALSIKHAIEIIDRQIDTFKTIANDARASLKIKHTMEDLRWEREELQEKFKQVR